MIIFTVVDMVIPTNHAIARILITQPDTGTILTIPLTGILLLETPRMVTQLMGLMVETVVVPTVIMVVAETMEVVFAPPHSLDFNCNHPLGTGQIVDMAMGEDTNNCYLI